MKEDEARPWAIVFHTSDTSERVADFRAEPDDISIVIERREYRSETPAEVSDYFESQRILFGKAMLVKGTKESVLRRAYALSKLLRGTCDVHLYGLEGTRKAESKDQVDA